jgi:hypothetical protein
MRAEGAPSDRKRTPGQQTGGGASSTRCSLRLCRPPASAMHCAAMTRPDAGNGSSGDSQAGVAAAAAGSWGWVRARARGQAPELALARLQTDAAATDAAATGTHGDSGAANTQWG